jgi:hypothetical protein
VTRGSALDGVTVARGLLGAAHVGDGATAEQRSFIQNLLVGYFGVDVDADSLEPIAPDGLGGASGDAEMARLIVLLAVAEFCRHPDHLGYSDEPLDAVRARCGIAPQAS